MKSLNALITESMDFNAKEEYAIILLSCYADKHPEIVEDIVKNQDELYKAWDDKESKVKFSSPKQMKDVLYNLGSSSN